MKKLLAIVFGALGLCVFTLCAEAADYAQQFKEAERIAGLMLRHEQALHTSSGRLREPTQQDYVKFVLERSGVLSSELQIFSALGSIWQAIDEPTRSAKFHELRFAHAQILRDCQFALQVINTSTVNPFYPIRDPQVVVDLAAIRSDLYAIEQCLNDFGIPSPPRRSAQTPSR